jgi:transcriptional regulator with XRE-family HTH domain
MPEPSSAPAANLALRAAREAVPLSRAELAEKVGAGEESVREWEMNGRVPRPGAQRAVCRVLKRTPAELGWGPRPGPPAPDPVTADVDARADPDPPDPPPASAPLPAPPAPTTPPHQRTKEQTP